MMEQSSALERAPEGGEQRRKRRGAFGLEWRIMVGIAAFFFVVVLIFYFTSTSPDVLGSRATGTVLLFFTIVLGLLPGLYIASWSRRMGRPRPEDRDDAQMAEGAGPVGSFPDSSIWPFILGLGASLCVVGFVFPFWLAILGGSLAIGALAGVVLESRRGGSV
jgi:hypothetical protein